MSIWDIKTTGLNNGGSSMHAHDRTLVTSLAMDRDRKTPEHDMACRYICRPEVADKFVEMAARRLPPRVNTHENNERPNYSTTSGWSYIDLEKDSKAVSVFSHAECHRASLEVPITKGEGQYQTTIGFADVRLWGMCQWAASWVEKKQRWSGGYGSGYSTEKRDWHEIEETQKEKVITEDRLCVIEVKTTPVLVSEAIRQIKLYRNFISENRYGYCGYEVPSVQYFLVTTYPVSATDRATLLNERILSVELGDEFRRWMATAADETVDAPGRVVL